MRIAILPSMHLRRNPIPIGTAIVAAALTACASRPSLDRYEDRVDFASEVLVKIAARRDRAPHDNPTVDSISSDLIAEFLTADEPIARHHAFVRMLDQIEDGHLSLTPLDERVKNMMPPCEFGRFDGRLWIQIDERDRVEDPAVKERVTTDAAAVADLAADMRAERGVRDEERVGNFGYELLAIDGYAPRTVEATHDLLCGRLGSTVDVRVRVAGTDEVRELTLLRAGRGYMASHALERSPPEGLTVLARHPFASDGCYAGIFAHDASIGFVRLSSSTPGIVPKDGDASCHLRHEPCDQLDAMLGLFRAVRDCDTLILDLQGSNGGTCSHAGAIAAAIMPLSIDPLPFHHLDESDRVKRLGTGGWKWKRDPILKPDVRFVVLIDEGCVSASEHLPGVLRAVPGTMLVGARTSGVEFSTVTIMAEGAYRIVFGGNPGIWTGLDLVEGRGIPPTHPTAYDESILYREGIAACVQDHRARTLTEALRLIEEERTKATRKLKRDAASQPATLVAERDLSSAG